MFLKLWVGFGGGGVVKRRQLFIHVPREFTY